MAVRRVHSISPSCACPGYLAKTINCEIPPTFCSVVDACIALRAYPSVILTEEVTTGRAAAKAILGLSPELAVRPIWDAGLSWYAVRR